MPRKRKHMDLRGLDSESTEYWEETLHRADLQMARGRSDRLSYVGDATQVELLIAIMTCHRYNYRVNDLTKDWLADKRYLNQQARVEAQRATWLRQLPPASNYKFFYGRGSRVPLADEIFLDCGDKYTDNPEKMKAICRYALAAGYDFLLRV
jgi:hypothetical protein